MKRSTRGVGVGGVEWRRALIIGVVYVNAEGLRVEETERLFEVMQVDVMKYEGKGFGGCNEV